MKKLYFFISSMVIAANLLAFDPSLVEGVLFTSNKAAMSPKSDLLDSTIRSCKRRRGPRGPRGPAGPIGPPGPALGNFIFVVRTTDVILPANGGFQPIPFDNVVLDDGWTRSFTLTDFSNPNSGIYAIDFVAQVGAPLPVGTNVSIEARVNGFSYVGSRSDVEVAQSDYRIPISSSFLINYTAGDILTFQAAATTNAARLTSFNSSAATVRIFKIN